MADTLPDVAELSASDEEDYGVCFLLRRVLTGVFSDQGP